MYKSPVLSTCEVLPVNTAFPGGVEMCRLGFRKNKGLSNVFLEERGVQI